MTYADHLRTLILAAFEAVPGLSKRSLSLRSDLGPNWVSSFLLSGQGALDKTEQVIATIRDLCPTGPQGDEVRRLLALFDEIAPPAPPAPAVEAEPGDKRPAA